MKKLIITLSLIILILPVMVNAKVSTKSKEDYANVVFFAYFSGTEKEEQDDLEYFNSKSEEIIKIYNDTTNARSFTNYLKTISYGKFNVHNVFPQLKNGKIVPLKLNSDIAYSYEKNNDSGIIDTVIAAYPGVKDIVDYNNDGFVDNITIILKSRDGYTAKEQSTFISHKGDYPGVKKYLDKYLSTYNIIGTSSITSAAVPAHEFLHSIGYPDLYRSRTNEGDNPVGLWDIMALASPGMPYPLAYLRSAISNWITIDTITESTTNLRLDEQTTENGNHAYILKSPLNEYEFFVVEYRKKNIGQNKLDGSTGASGIIVYRVNTTVEKYSNNHGKTGIYVFRKDDSLYNAALAANDPMHGINYRITQIGSSDLTAKLEDGALTYDNGDNSGIVIKNVSLPDGDYMTFDVEIPVASNFDLWNDTNLEDKTSSSSVNKEIELFEINNKLYSITFDGNTMYTQALENNKWVTKSTTTLQTAYNYVEHKKIVKYNNKTNLIYTDHKNMYIYEYNETSSTWQKKSTFNNTEIGYFDAIVDNNKIIITYIADFDYSDFSNFKNSINVVEYSNNTFTNILSKTLSYGGPIKILKMNNDIYIVYKYGNNKIGIFKKNGSNLVEVSSNLTAETFDAKVLNNKMYFVLCNAITSSETLKIKIFDGVNFEEIDSGLELRNPIFTISGGNLYIVANKGNEITYAYSFDEKTKTFNQEGHIVDNNSNALSSSLVSIGNNIYVGMVKMDKKIAVKVKETVNKLLSITVTPPKKTTYYVGDEVTTSGIKVYANYTKEQVEVTNYTVTNFKANKPGEFNATVTFEGVSNTFSYEVYEKPSEYKKGDVNKNGTIDLADVLKMLKFFFKTLTPTSEELKIADLNNDGEITLADILQELKLFFNQN